MPQGTYYTGTIDPAQQMSELYRHQFCQTLTTLYGSYQSQFDNLPAIYKQVAGGETSELLTRFGNTEIAERDLSIRNGDTPNMGTETFKVSIGHRVAEWGTLVEDVDIINMGRDPKSPLITNALGSLKATMDKFFMQGILKEEITIKSPDGTSKTLAFPTDTIVPYDNDQGVGPIGITPNKIQKAVQQLKIKDTARRFSHERPVIIISPHGWHELLKSEKMINRDYGQGHVLATGKIPSYLGCDFMEYNGNFPTKEVTHNSEKYVVKKIPIFYPSAIGKCSWLNNTPTVHCAMDPTKRFQNRAYIMWVRNYTWVDPDGIGYIECYEPL